MTTPRGECRRALAAGSKSFALAARLFPPARRDRVAAVYAWCRAADDAVDRSPPATRRAALEALRSEVRAIYAGASVQSVQARCFRAVVDECRIPEAYPAMLVEGLAMDVDGAAYETTADLEQYAYRVAGVVGLMLCHVMDVSDTRALPHAAALGIAMQYTNVCRDVVEDWGLGRVYLPASLFDAPALARLRASRGGAFPADARASAARAVRHLLDEADAQYRVADAGLRYLDRRSRIAVRTARLVYGAIGAEIRRRGYDVFRGRVVVPMRTKLRLAAWASISEPWTAPA